jgi:hypothetical protein
LRGPTRASHFLIGLEIDGDNSKCSARCVQRKEHRKRSLCPGEIAGEVYRSGYLSWEWSIGRGWYEGRFFIRDNLFLYKRLPLDKIEQVFYYRDIHNI